MNSLDQEMNTVGRKIIIFENDYTLTEQLMKAWIDLAHRSIEQTNRFTVALPGGRSPMEFYCRLSNYKEFESWNRTHIFMGDERFVPLSDDRSNFRMIKENLLDYVPIPPENIHPVPVGERNAEVAAELYKNELANFFEFKNNAPRFDLILLGVGDDGHTASLFPNDPRIDDPNRLVLPASLPPLKEDRVSLGFPVINNAKNVIVQVMGASKAAVFAGALGGDKAFPISKVNPQNGFLTFMVNKEAAQQLPRQDQVAHEGLGVLYEPPIS